MPATSCSSAKWVGEFPAAKVLRNSPFMISSIVSYRQRKLHAYMLEGGDLSRQVGLTFNLSVMVQIT